jgi:hypothetical protein
MRFDTDTIVREAVKRALDENLQPIVAAAKAEALREVYAKVAELVEEAERIHAFHLCVTARSAPDHRPCESAARVRFGARILETIADRIEAQP